MRILPFELEHWFGRYGTSAEIVLCSSGIEEFTLEELLELAGRPIESLGRITLCDSAPHGSHRLRQAIADSVPGARPGEVLVTHGASESLFLAMSTLLEPGSRLLLVEPTYQAHYEIARALNAEVEFLPLEWRKGFGFPQESFQGALRDGVDLVLLCFPNNPTGMTVDQATWRELITSALDAGAMVLSDEVFRGMAWNEEDELISARQVDPRCMVVGSLSKAYGLGGLRVGWTVAEQTIIERMRGLKDYTSLNLSPLSEHLALLGLQAAQQIRGQAMRDIRQNLATLETWLAGWYPLLEWVPPRAGVCAFPRVRADCNVERLCQRLFEEEKVFLLPGSVFGRPQHVRLGLGNRHDRFSAGLDRVSAVLERQALQPN